MPSRRPSTTTCSAIMADLAPFAASDRVSRGRQFTEDPPHFRSEFQRDRDRIVHSGAFRRLEYKTQVFVNHEGDMFRTRLTHSIEVAQIGRSIARVLRLNEDLTEAIALAHDLGHTPFGHAGQEALNEMMRPWGGFEHNLQSLRVVDRLEQRYAEFDGLNLTFETREGILKHCRLDVAAQLGAIGDRFIQRHQPGPEAQLADIVDAIAYNNHDVDDGLRAGLLTLEQLRQVTLFEEQYVIVHQRWPDLRGRRQIHEIIRRMINAQVIDLIQESQQRLAGHKPATIDAVRLAPQRMIAFSAAMASAHQELKSFLRHNLYQHWRVHRMTVKAQRILQQLFGALFSDSGLLPLEHQQRQQHQIAHDGEAGRARAVADYIAGMTDRYAILEHQRLFDPAELT
jgi:dGTPase